MEKELKFLLYSTPQENVKIDVVIKDETIWLTQKAMAMLFGVNQPAISKHLTNIFSDGELNENTVYSILEYTANDGKQYQTKFYNLDAIISVGYRINSAKATQFRIWATKTLKEFITKGFVLDDERLKQGNTVFGKDFYAMVQNKFHFAITGQTAAEIIYTKADKDKQNMGLTTWKNSPDGRILKSDIHIAKNYLQETQIRRLERTVAGYFDYIEDLIENENTFTMEQLSESVNEFLHFRKFNILQDKGKISKAQAEQKAIEEYDEFNKTQKIISDFDKHIAKLKGNEDVI